jgi:hypothetical protein
MVLFPESVFLSPFGMDIAEYALHILRLEYCDVFSILLLTVRVI